MISATDPIAIIEEIQQRIDRLRIKARESRDTADACLSYAAEVDNEIAHLLTRLHREQAASSDKG